MQALVRALTAAGVMFETPLDDDGIKAYLATLSDSGLSQERLVAGVRASCRLCKFMPRPADIIENAPAYEPRPAPQLMGGAEPDALDRAFSKAVFPWFLKWLSKEITRDEWLARLKWEAQKCGVEARMNWDEIPGSKPWEGHGARGE